VRKQVVGVFLLTLMGWSFPAATVLAAATGSISINSTRNDLKGKSITELLALLTSSDALLRGDAVRDLGRRKATDHKPAIRKLLSDPADFVRLDAAETLLKMGDTAGLATVREVMQKQAATQATRLRAAQLLAFNKDESGLNLARQQLTSPYFTRRIDAIRVLSASSDENVAYNALQTGLSDTNDRVRYSSIGKLGELGTVRGLGLLQMALRNPDSLGKAVTVFAIGKTRLTNAIPVLIDLLGSPDSRVRGIAAGQLNRVTGLSRSSIRAIETESAAKLHQEWQEWWSTNQPKYPLGTKIMVE